MLKVIYPIIAILSVIVFMYDLIKIVNQESYMNYYKNNKDLIILTSIGLIAVIFVVLTMVSYPQVFIRPI